MQLSAKKNLSIYLLIGFLQGVVAWAGFSFWPKESQLAAFLVLGMMTAVAVLGLTLQLTLGDRFNRQVLFLGLILGVVFTLVSVWLIYQLPDFPRTSDNGAEILLVSWSLSSILLAYILIPFVQAWSGRKNRHYNYTDLYRHSWDNFFVLLVATILTVAFWLLIVLWAMLFKMVGILLFKDLFFNPLFIFISLPVVLSLGIRMALVHENIIGALRKIALSLCYFLMPLSAVITILFGLSLPFTGLQPIWDTGYSTPILLCLLGANILFINGIFQDGSTPPYRGGLSRLVEIATLSMPVYAAIAIYSVYLRISQYGVTPNRFFLMVLVGVALCYSCAYTVAVFRRSQMWMGSIRQGNVFIALLISALIILIHSPLLNPVAWSAKDQYQRLISQKITTADFDFGALKFKLGLPGHIYLQQLRDLPPEHPLQSEIHGRILTVDAAQSYYQWKNNKEDQPLADHVMIETIDGSTIVPETFIDGLGAEQCHRATCYVLVIDLNRDAHEELIFFDMDEDWSAPQLYVQIDNGEWVKQGSFGTSMGKKRRQELIDKLKKEPYQAVDQQYQSLKVGEEVYWFK
jgi:hypothetical protein